MSGLNENQKRKILASIQYANKLLEEGLQNADPHQHPYLSEWLQDMAPSELSRVRNYIQEIRKGFLRLIEKCGIEMEPPRLRRSWKLRANLLTLDIALEDIYPERLLGYGEIEPEAAHQLTASIEEIRESAGRLVVFLSQPRDT